MKCPACNHEFGVPEGVMVGVNGRGISSSDPESAFRNLNPQSSLLSEPRARVRGPSKEYSAPFEAAWVRYGRKQEKYESYIRWCLVAPTAGGEEPLLRLCLVAFSWQEREWGPEGWKFAPYFHRYLKRRKWEDEPPPAPQAVPRSIDDRLSRSTDTKISEYRAAAARAMTPAELADVTRLNAKVSRG